MVFRKTIACIGLIFFLCSPAIAEKRVALVIGNSAYQHTSKLTNPKNDATDIAAALKKHKFQVIHGFDLDKASFDSKVREFATALRDSAAGVFFYAGHGLQVAGQNYLVPIDAKAEGAEALEFEMVRLDVIHRIMERQTNTNILFLDACRDNPLARNLARSMGTRSSDIGKGLAVVESGVGTLISFSTQPGNVALDGSGRNSPFAGALVSHLTRASDDLSSILIAVRNDVMKETQRKQVPWEHSALTGRFYFTPPQVASTAAPPERPQASEAERTWALVQGTKSVEVLKDFIARHKDTIFAKLAQERIEDLKQQHAPPAIPSPMPQPAAKSAALPPLVRVPPKSDFAGPPSTQQQASESWLRTLPVSLSATDIGRLTRFEENRKEAIAEAIARGDPSDRSELEKVLAGRAQPISDEEIVGDWRCRTFKLGGILPLTIYGFFKCRIFKEQGALVLQKTTGSQRTRGQLYRISVDRLAYVGAGTVNDDPIRIYGSDPKEDEVAVLFKTAPKQLRMEFPRPHYESKFNVIELVR